MALTNQAPWRSRRLSYAEMRSVVINQICGKSCWRFGNYLGSMLFFDFGGKVTSPSLRGGSIETGEVTLGVRDCHWILRRHSLVIIDSDLITDATAEGILTSLQGVELHDLVMTKGISIDLNFSNGMSISLDITNRHGTQDHIAEFVTSNGHIYAITPKGHFYLSDRVSAARFTGKVVSSSKCNT